MVERLSQVSIIYMKTVLALNKLHSKEFNKQHFLVNEI